jgi:hypothetical protein
MTRYKRMGYRAAVRWIADNDDTTVPEGWDAVDLVGGLISVLLVADIFKGGDNDLVARDVLRAEGRHP